jgi:hypothetical protein
MTSSEGVLRTFGGTDPYLVELIGLEPTTSSLRTKRSPKLSYSPVMTSRKIRRKSEKYKGIMVCEGYFGDSCENITAKNAKRREVKSLRPLSSSLRALGALGGFLHRTAHLEHEPFRTCRFRQFRRGAGVSPSSARIAEVICTLAARKSRMEAESL